MQRGEQMLNSQEQWVLCGYKMNIMQMKIIRSGWIKSDLKEYYVKSKSSVTIIYIANHWQSVAKHLAFLRCDPFLHSM